MNGYTRRTTMKREGIRNAAWELFSTYGIEKTSINEIAKKAKVSPASIYNYFGSKEGLLKDIALDKIEKMWEQRQKLWMSDLPFPELLQQAISNQSEFLRSTNLDMVETLLKIDEEVQVRYNEVFNVLYPKLMEKFLEKGRREGYIQRDISPKTTMMYLKMYQEFFQKPSIIQEDNKEAIKEIYDLMLYGLAGQPVTKD